MLNYHLTFESPWYLLLLLLLPVLVGLSFRGLVALGAWRRIVALGLRSLVLVLFILAVAEIQMVRISDKLTVIYLLDQSRSIAEDRRRAMIEYVNAATGKHRKRDDRVGVIVFGRDAAIEVPPFDDDLRMMPSIESLLDPEYTDLARAMRLAQASFPEDAAKRIVLVSDGNENLGDAVREAQGLAGAGVGIDVVPVRFRQRGEVLVDRVTLPSNIRSGQPFDLKVVVTNTNLPTADDPGTVRAKLRVKKKRGDQSVLVSEGSVTLPPGKRVYTIRQELDSAGFFEYEALVTPDRPDDDTMRENNRATAFTHIRGKGQVLLIEDAKNPGEFQRLVQALTQQKLEVTVRSAKNELFKDLVELQQYDTVVLADVPHERFEDAQVQMLVRNTQQMGAGLVMLGGPNSFGAGGWANTELEKAMPVDFQIKSAKVVPQGALAMIMHASEMAQGNHWQKRISEEALKALGPRDYCGVIHYTGMGASGTDWLWKPGMCMVGGNRDQMLLRLGRMTPGDMPDFDPGLVTAQKGFAKLPTAAIKHMIVISDGDPSPPSKGAVNALIKLKVTISTVAVGTHGAAGSRVLSKLANDTGGKYYKVNNPRALPKIFQREARRVAQPLVYENFESGFRPRVKFPHEMIRGIDEPLPLMHGFVLTTLKQNPLVEVSLVSPKPGSERNCTILASWTYGLGRAVAFTSDAGARWTGRWTGWENYDKLFGQIVGWSMRPTGDEGNFAVATNSEEGKVRVVVTALDKNDEFLNFLDMTGTAIGPDLKPVDIQMEQIAPGRYVGTFPGRDAGSYFIMVSPGAGKAPIRTGINVPYSDEFRGRATNHALLGQLAESKPKGSDPPAPGQLTAALEDTASLEPLLAVDSFRHDLPRATSSQDIWYYLVLAACCLFFFDVFVRRVQISFAWVPVLAGWVRDTILRRQPQFVQVETIDRLRSRKAEVTSHIEQLRQSTRFEPSPDVVADVELLEEPRQPPAPTPAKPSLAGEDLTEDDSYTARLLRAKKKAWEKR